MTDKTATIYDIAKELGINPSTVSRAFSNPMLVSEKTRLAVLNKAEDLGYKKNLVASQLRSQLSNIIALVVLQSDWNWFTSKLANGVQDAANELGYEIVVMRKDGSHTNSIQLCEQMRFAGVIVASTELGASREYTSDTIPTVYINRMDAERNRILPDDEYGIYCAVDHLYKCGHREIAYIDGPMTSLHSAVRKQSFLKRMKLLGLTVRSEWIEAANWSSELAYKAARRMLLLDKRPTAILSADDNMCWGVYRAAYELNIKIGEDLSVIGYDNTDTASDLTPGLTTVSFPLYEMGREAVKMVDCLVRNIDFEDRVTIHGELVERESVKRTAR